MAVDITTSTRVKELVKNYNAANQDKFLEQFGTGETFKFVKNNDKSFGVVIGDDDEFFIGETPTIAWKFEIKEGELKAYRSDEVLIAGNKSKNISDATEHIQSNDNQGMVPVSNLREIAKMLTILNSQKKGEEAKFYNAAKKLVQTQYHNLLTDFLKASDEDREAKGKKLAEFVDIFHSEFRVKTQEGDVFDGFYNTKNHIKDGSKYFQTDKINPENFLTTLKSQQNKLNIFNNLSDDSKESTAYQSQALYRSQTISSLIDALKDDGLDDDVINTAKAEVDKFVNDKDGLTNKELNSLVTTLLTEQAKAKAPGDLIKDADKISTIKKILSNKDTQISDKAIIKQDGNKVYIIDPNTENFSYSIKVLEVTDEGKVNLGSTNNYQNLKFEDLDDSITMTEAQAPDSSTEIAKLTKEIKESKTKLPHGGTDRQTALDEIKRKIHDRETKLKTSIEDAILHHKVLKEINPEVEDSVLEEKTKALFKAYGLEIEEDTDLSSITNFINKSPIKKEELNSAISELLSSQEADSKSLINKLSEEARTDNPEIINYFSELISPRSGNAVSPYVKELAEKIMLQIGTKQVPSQRLISELRQATKLPENFDAELKALIKEAQKSTDKIYLPAFSYDLKLKEAMQIVNDKIGENAQDQNLAEFFKLYNSPELPQEIADKHKDIISELRSKNINNPRTIRQALIAYYLASEKAANPDRAESTSPAYSHSAAEPLEYKSLQGKNFDMQKFVERFQSDKALRQKVYDELMQSDFSQDPDLSARMVTMFDTLFNPKNKEIYNNFNSNNLEYQKSLMEFAEKYQGFFQASPAFNTKSKAKSYEMSPIALSNFVKFNFSSNDKSDYTELKSLMSELGLFNGQENLISQLNPADYANPEVVTRMKQRLSSYSNDPNKAVTRQEIEDILWLHGYIDGNNINTTKIENNIKSKLDTFLTETFVQAQTNPAAFYDRADEEISRLSRIRGILGAENLQEKDLGHQTITNEEIAKSLSYFVDFVSKVEDEYDAPKQEPLNIPLLLPETIRVESKDAKPATEGSTSYLSRPRKEIDWSQIIEDTYSTKKNFADEFRLLA
jgi:hypothetical protein